LSEIKIIAFFSINQIKSHLFVKKIDRVIKYIENQGIALSDFERKSGLGNTYFTNTKKREADLSYKALMKIKENQPEHYYKIFPEEKPVAHAIGEHEPAYTVKGIIEPGECMKLKIEVGYLRQRVDDLVSQLNDKNEIIFLQRSMLKYEAPSKASG
jgi:hypothetical protein